MADVNPKMPLVQFPFSAGIEEGTRDEVVDGGAGWLVLENGRQDKRGGYSTRPGFTALANGLIDATSPTSGYKLLADRSTVVRVCDNTAQVFDGKSATWKSLGRVPECGLSIVDLPSMGTTSSLEDQEYCNGYVCLGWRVVNGVVANYAFYGIVNATTWAVVRKAEQLDTAATIGPTLVGSYSTYFIAVVPDLTAGNIAAYYLDTSTAATITTGWVSIGDIATDFQAGNAVSIQSLTSGVAVFYRNTSGGTDEATVKIVNITGAITTATVFTNSVLPGCTEVAGSDADTLWLAWNEALDIKVMGVDATTLATTSTVATITTTVGNAVTIGAAPSATAGKGRLFVNDSSGGFATIVARSFQKSAGATVTDGASVTITNATANGRPFVYAGRYYLPAFGDSTTNTQKICILVDGSEVSTVLRPVASATPGLASNLTYSKGKTFAGAVSSKRYFGISILRSGTADASALAEFDFDSPSRWQACAFGNSTFLTGGLTTYTDGVRAAEAGFLLRPQLPTTANSATGITAATGWRYACVYEEVDSDGNWHVSGVSTPSASTGAVANKTVTVTTLPLTISSRVSATSSQASSVRVAFYRTLDGGVAPYYRLGTTINNTAASTVTYADTTTDAVLATKAKLYSQPGVVGTAQDKRPPPGFSSLVSYNGMLVGATGSDVWYSGQNVSGEGTWFNPIFQVPVPGEGDITALWVQDGTLFVSKRREIFAISGEAPSDNGTSGGLGLPRRLAVDVGATGQRSVCTTAYGTIFQSDRGIEILTRAQSVEWIGEAIQTTLASYPIVTSVTVDPVSSCVLIELAAAESAGLVTGSGRTSVYDLTLKVWVSTDRRKNAAGTADTPSQSACMIYTGTAWRYAWLGTNGRVYHENSASYVDADGTFVAKRAISGNVKAAGLQGLQHVNRTLVLAKYHTAHDLNLSFAYDYNASFKTARLYTAAQLATLVAALPNMQLEHSMHDDTRCESVRVQLQDVTPSSGTLGTGQGATWVSLCLEVVPETGAYQLPNESR